MTKYRLQTLTTALGWLGVVLFVVIYAFELVPRHGPPITIHFANIPPLAVCLT